MKYYIVVQRGHVMRFHSWSLAEKQIHKDRGGTLYRAFEEQDESDVWEQRARRWIVPESRLNSTAILGTDGGFSKGKASWGWVLLLAPNWDVVDSACGVVQDHQGQRNIAGEFAAVVHGLRACEKRGVFATVVHDYTYVAGEVLGSKNPSLMAREYQKQVLLLQNNCAGFLWTPGHLKGSDPIIQANILADAQATMGLSIT